MGGIHCITLGDHITARLKWKKNNPDNLLPGIVFRLFADGSECTNLRAVRHEAVDQRVAVVEQRGELPGRLDRRGRRRAELLPLYRHRAAAGGSHPLHLPRHLPPEAPFPSIVKKGIQRGTVGGGQTMCYVITCD